MRPSRVFEPRSVQSGPSSHEIVRPSPSPVLPDLRHGRAALCRATGAIEELGHYDPMVRNPATQTVLNVSRIRYWLSVGAAEREGSGAPEQAKRQEARARRALAASRTRARRPASRRGSAPHRRHRPRQ